MGESPFFANFQIFSGFRNKNTKIKFLDTQLFLEFVNVATKSGKIIWYHFASGDSSHDIESYLVHKYFAMYIYNLNLITTAPIQ